MKCLWAGVSGIIEKSDTTPLARAKIEIFEETGINEDEIELLKSIEQIKIESAQYKNHEWNIFPFLFSTKNPAIKLDWEKQLALSIDPEKAALIHGRTGQHPGNNVPCTMCGGACVYIMLPKQRKYEKEEKKLQQAE